MNNEKQVDAWREEVRHKLNSIGINSAVQLVHEGGIRYDGTDLSGSVNSSFWSIADDPEYSNVIIVDTRSPSIFIPDSISIISREEMFILLN